MARVGELYLGGTEGNNNTFEVFHSGIGFRLSKRCELSKIYTFDSGNWEVEIKKNHHYIVARSKIELDRENIQIKGFEYCQKTLDIISVTEERQLLSIESPGEFQILLFKSEGEFILSEFSYNDLSVDSHVVIKKYDRDGNELIEPPRPQLNWMSAFRYYRLSQSSKDLFEAYRNLFLGFESILYEICPKYRQEGEKKWLFRALNIVNSQTDLSHYVPDKTINPVSYIIDKQYDNIRCKLFHAKGSKAILPYESLNPSEVAEAYGQLIKLWQHIASFYFNTPSGGGVMTNIGFKSLMKNCLEGKVQVLITDDNSPPKKDDIEVSPINGSIYKFDLAYIIDDFKPGEVLVKGEISLEHNKIEELIYRICVKADNDLFSVGYIIDGLNLIGINFLESNQVYRLINKQLPITNF